VVPAANPSFRYKKLIMRIKQLEKMNFDNLLAKLARFAHSHATKNIDPEIKKLKINADD
tara:strand:- start:490 stop:666 length:177 start_codon:yes stop_codon:yes gene_type:complete